MITIQQRPQTLSPVYNDMVYILSSTNVSQTNFKFVVDIYEGATLVNRLLVPPHPTHLTGFVNIAPVLEGLITQFPDKNVEDNDVSALVDFGLSYQCKFGEQYGSSGTIYPDLVTDTSAYTWGSVFDYPEYCTYSSGDYTASVADPCQFLTNKATSGDIMIDDNAWLYWLRIVNAGNNGMARISTYDSSGTLIQNAVVGGSFGAKGCRIPSGPRNINLIQSGSITGSIPIITASVAKYCVTVLDHPANQVPVTTSFWYTIVSNCSRYEKTRIQFLNKLGGYDFFNFTLVSKQASDIERTTYKKNLGSYTNANSYAFSPSDRSRSQFYTKIVDRVTINSDWLSEDVYNWLEELVTSPDVYVDNGTYLQPINITNASFEQKKTVNQKLFNLTLEYTISYDRYRQRL